jgi:hypothetical protein
MQTRTKLIIACFLFAMVAHMAGCGRDGDAVVVDFSKTVAVERPKSRVSAVESSSSRNNITQGNLYLLPAAVGLHWQ